MTDIEFGWPIASKGTREPGMYASVDLHKTDQTRADLFDIVSSDQNYDWIYPLSFELHVEGFCFSRNVITGARLEWEDLAQCSP